MRQSISMASLVLAATLGTLLGACGQETSSPGGTTVATPSTTQLSISVDPGDGQPSREWTLRCDPPGGDHPAPEEACAAISGATDPFRPVPPDTICTEQYGGPQTATISGTWQGDPVEASYRRTNGCEISRWDALAAVSQTEDGHHIEVVSPDASA